MSSLVKVMGANELKPGENKVVNVNGSEIALFNVDGQFHAIANTCPHRGGPLGEGILEGDVVQCPWHGWRFNVRTGANVMMPMSKVQKYEVKIEGGDIFLSVE